ncbi:fumarylacetoacetate hydrolase family protein [Micromonospora sp. NBC_01813]|uniref:fumarylacetoacetate hydrolase family protein n=1 Tax=Micromonospora sp. NBC_01813 TaxID=2975988 RepID=UPI002DDA23EA|nr:fumarylacetoacetate hydrolase family protein [Micromonospora sp. NBC_01813]WSA10072.1 fumarylacetoacetate hydrolase family protein [Micromonospora sp. NBC_01813]
MRLATIRTATGTAAVRLDPEAAVELGVADVGELLTDPGWADRAAAADGARHPLDGLDHAPLITRPEKIVCVGLNYRRHILEMGRELPEYPTIFAKYPSALIGAGDPVILPAASGAMDWEVELAVVIGTPVRHATDAQAAAAIAGYTVLNDVTARDWQYRTPQWLAGKTFEATTPLGPCLVTPDELDLDAGLAVECLVNGEVVQRSDSTELVFGPARLVSYLSTIFTLRPGDVIATGTPGGVGHARKPPRYLADGDLLVTRIGGIGECRNTCRSERR